MPTKWLLMCISGEGRRRRARCRTRPSSPTRSSPRRSPSPSPPRTTCTDEEAKNGGKIQIVFPRRINQKWLPLSENATKRREEKDSQYSSEIYTLSSLQENNCDTSRLRWLPDNVVGVGRRIMANQINRSNKLRIVMLQPRDPQSSDVLWGALGHSQNAMEELSLTPMWY